MAFDRFSIEKCTFNCQSEQHIGDEQLAVFKRYGLLLLKNVINQSELASLQTEATFLIDKAITEAPSAPAHIGQDSKHGDYVYRLYPNGETLPFRINHVIAKSLAARCLLANSNLLSNVAKIIGEDFIPTWDTLGYRRTGSGINIPWHRDANAHNLDSNCKQQIFNCDVYLDRASDDNCLWVIPGSHEWSQERISLEITNRADPDFSAHGAIPLTVDAGDIVLRNVLLFNGAPPSFGKNLRKLYFEYRSVPLIKQFNWFNDEFIAKKRAMLARCVQSRLLQAVTAGDTPYPWPHEDDGDRQFRFPHEDYGWT